MIGSIVLGYVLLGTGVFLGLLASDESPSKDTTPKRLFLGWLTITALWLLLALLFLWAHLEESSLPENKDEKRNG